MASPASAQARRHILVQILPELIHPCVRKGSWEDGNRTPPRVVRGVFVYSWPRAPRRWQRLGRFLGRAARESEGEAETPARLSEALPPADRTIVSPSRLPMSLTSISDNRDTRDIPRVLDSQSMHVRRRVNHAAYCIHERSRRVGVRQMALDRQDCPRHRRW